MEEWRPRPENCPDTLRNDEAVKHIDLVVSIDIEEEPSDCQHIEAIFALRGPRAKLCSSPGNVSAQQYYPCH